MTELPFKQVSNEEAEEASFVVCMRDLPDDPKLPLAQVFGKCARCGHAIYWSRTAPEKPEKVCIKCAVPLMAKEGAEILTTERQRREVEEWLV